MKFSIRDLLFVTVIVAMAVAWWLDHRRQANEIKKLKEQWLVKDFIWSDVYGLPASLGPAPNPPRGLDAGK
jgi:hypothetical protein